MADFSHSTTRELEEFLLQQSDPEPEVLYNLYRITHLQRPQPEMVSGHLQGRFLSMLSKLIRPRNVIEIGTFTGYSALCLAEGLAPDGMLYTFEVNPENALMAREEIAKSPLAKQITVFTGDALKRLPELTCRVNLAFIDADKSLYCDYYDAIMEKKEPGGLIIADNVLWHGAYKGKPAADRSSQGIARFNERVRSDNRVEKLMLPLRDGIYLIRKQMNNSV